MSANTNAEYWTETYAATTAELAEQTGQTVEDTAAELAFIAGDYADMTDRDVIVTFYGDHELPHKGHFPHFGGGWYCDTCESPYCELA